MSKLKGFRITDENLEKMEKLLKIYKVKSEAQLINLIIEDIYELKKSKALIPFEEYEKRDLQLQKALFEIGKLQGILQEKEKQLEELQKKTKQEEDDKKNKSFWAKLFGR